MSLKRLNICLITVVFIMWSICKANGQAINPMMYGMGQYMNPYYTGFYGGFGNMGHMNPLGYQLSSGMAVPGVGGNNQQGFGGGGYGGGGGYWGAATTLSSSRTVFITLVFPLFTAFLLL